MDRHQNCVVIVTNSSSPSASETHSLPSAHLGLPTADLTTIKSSIGPVSANQLTNREMQVASGGGFPLDMGQNRYFWLTREEQLLPARLLCIYQEPDRMKRFNIAIEILMPGGVGLVDSLRSEDLPTLLRDHRHSGAIARARFEECLTGEERAALALADGLGLRTYPLDVRNLWIAPFGYLGSLNAYASELLEQIAPVITEQMVSVADSLNVSVAEIFARVSPKFFARHLMRRVFSHGDQLFYRFVITEKGTLKLSPKSIAARKFNLRLSHLRPVFATGCVQILRDGTVSVTLDAEDYGINWSAELANFIAAVFARQADITVSMVEFRNEITVLEYNRQDSWDTEDGLGYPPFFDEWSRSTGQADKQAWACLSAQDTGSRAD